MQCGEGVTDQKEKESGKKNGSRNIWADYAILNSE